MKKLFTFLLAALCSLSVWAHDFKVGSVYYKILAGNNVEVTYRGNSYDSYSNEYSGSITIPKTVTYNSKTYSVTSIGDYAFMGCDALISITIPNSVTTIGNYAFYNCSGLTSITIPNSVTTIGNYAFGFCVGLTSITIPNSVTSIGDCAFYVCNGLTSITIPKSVTSIGEYAFADCTGLTSVTIGNGVTSIGSYAFGGCGALTSITIPNSVKSIGSYAFGGCNGLTSITIPNSVTGIGESAFEDCTGLTSVTIGNGVTSIGKYAFQYCHNLKYVKIGTSVKSIGEKAFYGCYGLMSLVVEEGNMVYDSRNNCNAIIKTTNNTLIAGCKTTTIPNNVTSIGSYAFYGCNGLTSITIPNSVTSIGESAFQNCNGLTSVTIGNGVTSIGKYAFQYCYNLKYVKIGTSVKSIGEKAFYGCYGLMSLVVEEGNMVYDSRNNCNAIIETTSNTLIAGCKTTTIPNNVTSIGEKAFYDCNGLTSITIPNSVTSIGESAFEDCGGLTSVTIGNGVTSIGKYAFQYCHNLKYVKIGTSVKSIGEKAFYGCTSNNVVINHSALNIVKGKTTYGYVAYYASVILKESETIGEFVFGEIDGKDYAIAYLGNDSQITLPADYHGSSYGIGPGLFRNNTTANSITISNAVTSIGDQAFNGCSELNVVYIGNSVISIGNSAFYNCPNLYKIIMLPNSVPTGINSAFQSLSYRITYVGNKNYQRGYDVLGSQRVYSNLNSYFSVDGIVYALVNPSQRTCDIIDCDYSGTTTEFSIGNTVVYKNIELTIDSININAFRNNTKMTKMVVDCNHSLPSYMATGCSYLDTLTITSNVGTIGYCAFKFSSTNSSAYYFINNSGNIHLSAFEGCTGLSKLSIANSVRDIGEKAFHSCEGIVNADIYNNGKIGKEAFRNSSLKSKATYYLNNKGAINNYAFANCSAMKTLVIDSCVGTIGQYAFQKCSALENVTIKNNGMIGASAFNGSSTESSATYAISNVDSIGESAFANCTAMKNLTVDASVTTIGQSAFQNCSGLESVTVQNNGMIGASAFEGSSTTNMATYNISNVGSIGESAFANCTAMYNLVIDSCVGHIGKYAFQNCTGLTNVTIKNNGMIGASAFNGSSTESSAIYAISNVGSIGESAFANCTAMKNLTVDASVTTIGQSAFQNCSGLESVTVQNNGMIGASAFEGSSTTNMATYNISNVGSIGESAFANCTKLQKVHFGRQVGDLNQRAFYNCILLDSLILPNTVTALGDNVFYNCNNLAYIQLSNSLSTIGDAAFDYCNSLPAIFVPKSVSSIGEGAFRQCTSLSVVGFEDGKNPLLLGRNSANKGLFCDCPLDSVYIGRELSYQNTEAYGYSPFYRSSTLRSVVISDIPTKIEANEFYGCTNLYYVLIGNGAQSIGDYAFSGCSAIDYFRFGSQVKTIGAEAFSDCVAMTRLYTYCQQPPICGASALEDIDKWSCTLYIPDGTLAAYIAADQWKDFFFVEENNLKFTITWKNEDGSIFDQTEVSYGLIPTHAAPVKPSTELYSYTFAGWSPEVVAATSDATYTATYTSELRKYTVTFLDEDGTTLSAQDWEYGTMPTCDEPIKPADAQYTYTFAGWTPTIVAVTADATYTATYNETVNKYTITATAENGTVQGTGEYDYGTVVELMAIADTGYKFDKWSDEVTDNPRMVTVTENMEFTALFISDVGASIEDIHATSNKVQKVLIDGILYILRDGKTYNVMGQEL